ncbi:MAG: effector binding domain-containing protein [Pseudomonadota bacterium]
MLTIGQMAKIFAVSTKTLRHYDALGLFVPALTERDNNYRYYHPSQIAHLQSIVMLRRLDVPLDAIAQLSADVQLDDKEQLLHFLSSHAQLLRVELACRQRLLIDVETPLNQLTHWRTLKMQANIVNLPAFTVVGMEYRSSDAHDSIPAMWQRYLPRENEIPAIDPSVSYGVCCPQGESQFRYIAGLEVSSDAAVPEGMVRVTVPAQKYAVFTHTGPTTEIITTFQTIYGKLLAEQNLHAAAGTVIDLERYDERFLGTDNEKTQVDLYIAVA